MSWSPDQAEFDRSQLVTFLRAVDRNLGLLVGVELRCWPHDVEGIVGIHQRHPLTIKTFVERFETELRPIATMDQRILSMNVVMMAAALWGLEEAGKLAPRWGVTPPKGLLPRKVSKRSKVQR